MKDSVRRPEKGTLRAHFRHSTPFLSPEKLGETTTKTKKKKMRGKPVPGKAILVLCMVSFLAGLLFTTRTWTRSSDNSFNKERHLQFIPLTKNRVSFAFVFFT